MKSRETVFLILFIMTLGQLGTDIYLPSFSSIALSLHTDMNTVQLSFTFFLASLGLSQLVYGPLIDRFGRKLWLLFGLSLYCVMSLAASMAHSVEQLIMLRSLQGLGAGACSVIPRAIMRDVFSDKKIEKLAVYQSLVWSLIPILAPLLGSYIQYYLGWRYNFLFLFGISTVALVAGIRYTETLEAASDKLALKKIVNHYLLILKNRQFSRPLICSIATVSLLTVFNVSSPMLLENYLGLSTLQYGWSLVAVSLAFMLGIVINRIAMTYISTKIIEILGVIIIFFAANSFLFVTILGMHSFYSILAPIFSLQLGCALIFPANAAKAMSVYPEKAGIAAAVFGSSLFLGGTLVSGLVAMLPSTSLIPIASLFIVIACIILIVNRLTGVNHESIA